MSKRKRRRKKETLSHRNVSSSSTNLFSPSGKFIGTTQRQPAPRVGSPKRDWERKEYFTFLDIRDREHGVGRIQFQRSMKTGQFNLNYQKVGFNSCIVLDERMIEKIGRFWAYAHEQVTRGQLPIIDKGMISEFKSAFREGRKHFRRKRRKT